LFEIDLQLAKLQGTNLEGANLRGAKLQGARNQEQLDAADGDDRTLLPEGFTRQAHWTKIKTEGQPDAQPDNAGRAPAAGGATGSGAGVWVWGGQAELRTTGLLATASGHPGAGSSGVTQ
jgi:uncharacterized protein YjbI with pentapeptide repeats